MTYRVMVRLRFFDRDGHETLASYPRVVSGMTCRQEAEAFARMAAVEEGVEIVSAEVVAEGLVEAG